MQTRRWFAVLALAVSAFFAGNAQAQVGNKLPPLEIAEMAQTGAKGIEDYQGRAILIEFFAYW